VLILGLDNAGKTTIVKKLCGQSIEEIEPTLGFQIESLEYQNYKLNLWDIGGQSSIRAYWRNYFEQTDGLVWVVDSADLSRLDLVRQELEKLLLQERLAGATLLIWANKQDIQGSLPPEKIAESLGMEDGQFQNRHWSIHACSAVTGDGLMEGMDWLIEDISSRIFLLG
jgi:ADP-ribosylation factor-like protein 2